LSRQLGIPCTFDPGAPLHYSKAARTVTAYLRWISSDFEAMHLIRMMYDGVPDFSEWKDHGIRGGRLSCAALLREAGIGHGRERHLDRIDARIAAVEHAVANGHAESKQIHEYRADRAWIARLLEVTPAADADGKLSLHASAEAVRVLVTEMSRDKFPGEQEALERLALLLGEYRDGSDLKLTPADLADLMIRDIRATTFPLVLQQPGAEPLRVTSPQPGHLHISTIDRGGWSGRPFTLVLGVDAATLPRQAPQNPVLLDSERRSINEKEGNVLPLAEHSAARSAHAFECLLRRLSGSVTLSWSEADPQAGGTRFPSRLLLDALRRQRNDELLQSGDLLACCGEPLGPVPEAAPTSMAEWWLRQYTRTSRAAFTNAMREAHPMLDRGSEAVAAREGRRFTAFDGLVPPDTFASPLEKPLSASRLEGLASCPYRFFLSTVLQLSPPESWEYAQDRWLDAAQRGQAVHEILHRFMQALSEEKDVPVREQHRALLNRICGQILDACAERIPLPSDLLRSEEERVIRSMLQVFFREETTSDRVPIALERPFGHRRGGGDPLPALEMTLPGGTMQVSGTIDRVDRASGDSIIVIDYKTGTDKVDPQNPLAGGRTLQHALYAEAVRRYLISDETDPTSLQSEYMFLSAREQGRRVRMPDTRTELPLVLELLRSLIAGGVFPHATDNKECRYCDFAELCGEAGSVSRQSARKMENVENTVLETFRRMQHD
jgi:ATP-dependent helicase/nuclease subunit B